MGNIIKLLLMLLRCRGVHLFQDQGQIIFRHKKNAHATLVTFTYFNYSGLYFNWMCLCVVPSCDDICCYGLSLDSTYSYFYFYYNYYYYKCGSSMLPGDRFVLLGPVIETLPCCFVV